MTLTNMPQFNYHKRAAAPAKPDLQMIAEGLSKVLGPVLKAQAAKLTALEARVKDLELALQRERA